MGRRVLVFSVEDHILMIADEVAKNCEERCELALELARVVERYGYNVKKELIHEDYRLCRMLARGG